MYYETDIEGITYGISTSLIDTCHVILSDKGNPTVYLNSFYSYNVYIPLNSSVVSGELYDAAVWCEENCKEPWLVGVRMSAFVDELDIMAFKLRWM